MMTLHPPCKKYLKVYYRASLAPATVDGITPHDRKIYLVGLNGITVAGLSLSQGGRVLIAAGYQSGIWRAVVPVSP